MDILSDSSPEEGAEFYMNSRNTYHFADSIYGDSIMPYIEGLDYFTLKHISQTIEQSPYALIVEEAASDKRADCLAKIKKEIEGNMQDEYNSFNKYILPALRLSLDSMVQNDVEEIMNKYAGGILNYRKIAFVFGRNRNDFKDMFWQQFDTLKYEGMIKEHLTAFIDTIYKNHDCYLQDMVGKKNEYNKEIICPKFVIGLSQSTLRHVNDYTKGETDDILNAAFKDFVAPLAIGAVSGGAGILAELYDVANTAYDVVVTIDDIKSEEVSKDDMVKYITEHDITYQIDNYYLNLWVNQVARIIEESNNYVYDKIEKEL